MDSLIQVIVTLVIIALLALEGAYVYFWIARKGRHTSFHSQYTETTKCPLCGSEVPVKKSIRSDTAQKLEHQPVH